MTLVPEFSFDRIVATLSRLGFLEHRRNRCSIHLKRKDPKTGQLRYLIIPARRPVSRDTLMRALKDAGIRLEEFLDAL